MLYHTAMLHVPIRKGFQCSITLLCSMFPLEKGLYHTAMLHVPIRKGFQCSTTLLAALPSAGPLTPSVCSLGGSTPTSVCGMPSREARSRTSEVRVYVCTYVCVKGRKGYLGSKLADLGSLLL